MNEVKLNLARKWRSKQFSEIIGQELPVRMLKNSLYRDHYFPVYLFSGQRGCGKTTTARVFAAAVNCEQLATFQKNPKSCTLPCLQCGSCLAMTAGKHPDFIEIDAASHTGVDNVRSIIESSSLMPLMGSKKIYLIDEAHMLSKSAFNALLKIMEEPPASVLFILATTDAQKILETVKSRCFQLFFDPVAPNYLLDHLIAVCQKESIRYDKEGLEIIIRETEGSVRDALNMIEQVRFASSMVTKEGVLSVLGHLDDERILELAQLVITSKPKQLLLFLQQNRIADYRAEYIWSRFMALMHALLWVKYGVRPDEFVAYHNELQQLARLAPIARIHAILSLFSQNEILFARTTAQHSFLEMILLQLCFTATPSTDENGPSSSASQNASPSSSGMVDEIINDEDADDSDEDEEVDDEEDEEELIHEDAYVRAWKVFLHEVELLGDPLLESILRQGDFVKFDAVAKKLTVSFAKDLSFFSDKLLAAQKVWMPLLVAAFKSEVVFDPLFDQEKKQSEPVVVAKPVGLSLVRSNASTLASSGQAQSLKAVHTEHAKYQHERGKTNIETAKSYTPQNQYPRKQQGSYPSNGKQNFQRNFSSQPQSRGVVCNVSDKEIWVKANMLLQHFPGTVYEMARPNPAPESTQ